MKVSLSAGQFVKRYRYFINNGIYLMVYSFLVYDVYLIFKFPFVKQTVVMATSVQPVKLTELSFDELTRLPLLPIYQHP